MEITIYYYLAGIVILLVVLQLISRRAGWSVTEIRQIVAALVEAAEQMIPDEPGVETGEEKLSWVLNKADEIGITKHINSTLLRAFIEASVLWVKRSKPALPAHMTRMHSDNQSRMDRG